MQKMIAVGKCFLQALLAALMSNLKDLNIFRVVLLLGPILCHTVGASHSGTNLSEVFYCVTEGCANVVTHVYCNDEEILKGSVIPDCSGRPPAITVCKHGGRAFVSNNKSGTCEFENGDYIITKKCRDHEEICDFFSASTVPPTPVSTLSPVNNETNTSLVVGVVIGVAVVVSVVVAGLVWYIRTRNKRNRGQKPAGDPAEDVPL